MEKRKKKKDWKKKKGERNEMSVCARSLQRLTALPYPEGENLAGLRQHCEGNEEKDDQEVRRRMSCQGMDKKARGKTSKEEWREWEEKRKRRENP